MNSITDYLDQLQKLTLNNLEILKSINDSFYTKNNHISVKIGDTNYAMPSFISLENKINYLEEGLHNLINAPTTGEAYFNMDGNSRSIEVRGYTHTPNSLVLNPTTHFETYKNNIFKDFLTPVPYINVDLYTLPNDITSVNIKKIIPRNSELIERFKSILNDEPTKVVKWSDIYKIISIYKKDVDYVEYERVNKLPIRKNIGAGTYVIESILADYIDQQSDNMDNYIKLKLRTDLPDPYISDLSYRLFNETIYKPLQVGDELVTYDDSAKMRIEELDPASNTILVKVMNGEYLNLGSTDISKSDTNISDLCKIKFYSPVDFDKDKYIKVPLEEDQYVFIAVAPLNDRMNIQSPWGSGLVVNSFDLKWSQNENITFKEYYDNNVKNIGDILFELTSVTNNNVTSLTPGEFAEIQKAVPIINPNDLQVQMINHHLNDSETVKNIRALYSQKNRYKTELAEIQTKIDNINDKLAKISFDDTTGVRSAYDAQLTEYNSKKSELIASITKVIDEISLSANNAEIPIENAKYRIRGSFNYNDFLNGLNPKFKDHVKGIQVWYRYKNLGQPQSTAQSINKFLFSDWNIMGSFLNPKTPKYKEGNYVFENQPNNDQYNEPSFNQIDIPISQGETVDIKLKVIYDYGYPFVETCSQWSDIINIKFPQEFLKNVQVLDIISENNNDIETNRFENIIKEKGIPDHINDKIVDQDLTYYHRPENISSGFYTSERRIIPLKDKLSEMANSIIELQDEIAGSSADSLDVYVVNGEISNKLFPYQTNNISVESYNIFVESAGENKQNLVANGIYNYNTKTGVVSTTLNLTLSNVSKHTVKLYSMFPGSRDNTIGDLKGSVVRFVKDDFEEADGGVWMRFDKKDSSSFKLQSANQFITFRIKDIFNGENYYGKNAVLSSFKLPLTRASYDNPFENDRLGMIMYPNIREEFALCMNNDNIRTYTLLAPGETIVVPIYVEYKLKGNDELDPLNIVTKTMSFDVRTSLYNDPITYTFQVTAKLDNTIQDNLINSNRKFVENVNYKSTVIK